MCDIVKQTVSSSEISSNHLIFSSKTHLISSGILQDCGTHPNQNSSNHHPLPILRRQ